MVAGNPMRYIGRTEDFVKRVEKMNVMSMEEHRLKGDKRRQFIENIPDEKMDHKNVIVVPEK